MLRTPFLLSNEHWLSSLSICIRTAQMLLSIYFDVLGPSIQAIARTGSPTTDREWKFALRVNQLPPT
jgi:type II secretory pathway component PulC